MKKRILIGLGTGRCGTTSLARLLDSAANCHATHEMNQIRTYMSWEFARNGADKAIKELESRPEPVVGDVAFYYLPHVEYISASRPGTTFVCLRRNKEETVESYMIKTKSRDHWRVGGDKPDPWNRLYPKFSGMSKRDAIGSYWDMYYETTDRMEGEGLKIRTFEMSDLNDERGVAKILEFCGLSSLGVVSNFHENASATKAKNQNG